MPGTLFGILDAVGFLLAPTVLFLPLAVLPFYVLWEAFQTMKPDSLVIRLVEIETEKEKRIKAA